MENIESPLNTIPNLYPEENLHTNPFTPSFVDTQSPSFINQIRMTSEICQCSKILIIDDNSFNIMSIELIIENLHFNMDFNKTSDSALNG